MRCKIDVKCNDAMNQFWIKCDENCEIADAALAMGRFNDGYLLLRN
jgi:hypothetical protein